MDSSAVEDEEVDGQQEAAAQDEKSSPDKSVSKVSGKGRGPGWDRVLSGLWTLTARFVVLVAAVGEILEGKRAKKSVDRLDFQAPKQKEKLKIGDGKCWRWTDAVCRMFPITARWECCCFRIFRQRRETGRHSTNRIPDHQDEAG